MPKNAKISLKLSYNEQKLKAIETFLGQKNLNFEDEIQKYFDTLFKKYVPKDVRIFIEHSLDLGSSSQKKSKEIAPDSNERSIKNEAFSEKNPFDTSSDRSVFHSEIQNKNPETSPYSSPFDEND